MCKNFHKVFPSHIFQTESRYCSVKRYFPLQKTEAKYKNSIIFPWKIPNIFHIVLCFTKKKISQKNSSKILFKKLCSVQWKVDGNDHKKTMQEFMLIKHNFLSLSLVQKVFNPLPTWIVFRCFSQSFTKLFFLTKDSRKKVTKIVPKNSVFLWGIWQTSHRNNELQS